MQRVALACAAFAFAFLPSALAAQQTGPDQSASQGTPPPPPMPPMPGSHDRWVDVGGGHHSSRAHSRITTDQHSSAIQARHHTSSKQKPATRAHHHATSKEHHATKGHHETKHERTPAVHASKRTISRCHKMTYSQIMRESSCRALMKQDLETAESRHASHQKAKHQKSKHGHDKDHKPTHKSAKDHKATHQKSSKRRHHG